MDAGGRRKLICRKKREAEYFGAAAQTAKLAAKEAELRANDNGRPLSSQQVKQVRDAVSGAQSNKMRKTIYDLSHADAKYMLVKPWELYIAFAQKKDACPFFNLSSASGEVSPPRPR